MWYGICASHNVSSFLDEEEHLSFPSIIVAVSPPGALFAAMKLFGLESGLILGALSIRHWLEEYHYHGELWAMPLILGREKKKEERWACTICSRDLAVPGRFHLE